MPYKEAISVVVPTLNEADNITGLFERIDQTMTKAGVGYEIVLVDDHSTDGTVELAEQLAPLYNVRVLLKQHQPGKAHSLLEGFAAAQYPLICMIDADLQYPPEAIAPMHRLLTQKHADIVISERVSSKTSFIRKLSSKIFNFIFARLLFGITYDTQSGLKLFQKRVLNDIELTPSPWSFDLEFLVRALESKRTILSYRIPFADRTAGVTKVKLLSTTLELAKASLKLRWNTSTKAVRAGHRANNVFVERSMPLGVITSVACSIIFLAAPLKAEAVPLRDSSGRQDLTSQVSEAPESAIAIVRPIDLDSPGGNFTQPPIIPITPVPEVPEQPPLPTPLPPDLPTAPTPPVTPPSSETAVPVPPVPSTSPPTTRPGNARVATAHTLQPAESRGHLVDSSKLSAATATRPFTGYNLSSQDTSLTERLVSIARSVLIGGVFCIVAFILMRVFNIPKKVATQRSR